MPFACVGTWVSHNKVCTDLLSFRYLTSQLTVFKKYGHFLTGLIVSGYPAPYVSSPCSTPFSAAEFFRDSPWLNVPSHRKADILIEPLYPRLGLLGGAPESGGKVSKLAALAAARKKKEAEKASPETPDAGNVTSAAPPGEPKSGSLSLLERLSGNGKEHKPTETGGGLRALTRGARLGNRTGQGRPSLETHKPKEQPSATAAPSLPTEGPMNGRREKQPPAPVDLRASPSTFATIIVGDATRSTKTQPSHLPAKKFDVMEVFGQDLTEAFDFAGPSPDDVVLNAQSASKGLPIRRHI